MQFMTATYTQAETVFITVGNAEGAELEAGAVVEFDITATDADQGHLVELVDIAVVATTGIAAPLAGVILKAIPTGGVGRSQVYGPATVRTNTTIAAGRLAVATSSSVSPTGVAIADVQTTTTTAAYAAAALGIVYETVDTTHARVQLQCM
mgnify:CR=1|jgi:hypothetical protein|tara:strand:- start:1353 stop:1805 length:453 start_codon:yes stop_codon:yes gene_type:complete